jgi:hypothetical protein
MLTAPSTNNGVVERLTHPAGLMKNRGNNSGIYPSMTTKTTINPVKFRPM